MLRRLEPKLSCKRFASLEPVQHNRSLELEQHNRSLELEQHSLQLLP